MFIDSRNEPDLQEKFLEQIRSQIKSLIYDVHGNYVILKCLDTLPKEALMFMMPAI
jgi:pumilio RNA-binding family